MTTQIEIKKSKRSEKYYERNRKYSREYYYKNKEKAKAYQEKWYRENRDKKLVHNMKRTGGIIPTTVNYQQLFDEQKGCCKLCGIHRSQLKRALDVDHCHSTGKIRGLLCSKCNLGIGLFKNNMDLFEKAKNYLEGKS